MLLPTIMAFCTTREVSKGLRTNENQFYLLFFFLGLYTQNADEHWKEAHTWMKRTPILYFICLISFSSVFFLGATISPGKGEVKIYAGGELCSIWKHSAVQSWSISLTVDLWCRKSPAAPEGKKISWERSYLQVWAWADIRMCIWVHVCMVDVSNAETFTYKKCKTWHLIIFSYWVTTENILAMVLNLKCSFLISLNYGLSFCELKTTNQFSFIFFSVFLTQGNAFCKRVFIFNGFFNEFFSQAINNAINYRQLVLKCMLAS